MKNIFKIVLAFVLICFAERLSAQCPTTTITGVSSFCAGNSTLLHSNANANGGTLQSFQWKKNNANISGATDSTYVATSGGNYKVKVTNTNNCSMTSPVFVVTTIALPTANISNSASICEGFTADLAIIFTGTAPWSLTYNDGNNDI